MTTKQLLAAYEDPKLSAKLARVTYIEDLSEGWHRERHGTSFIYTDQQGKKVTAPKAERVAALHIPPAWQDVVIAPSSRAHIQATGRDKKGQKQYIYNPDWNAFRGELKYKRLVLFAEVLPTLRAKIQKALAESEPTRERAIAAALSLVDMLALRIGNEGYAHENNTYGVTTLRNKHIQIHGDTINLNFVGKSHVPQEFVLRDKKLAKALKAERDIPGARLFQYFDEHHAKHPLTSGEVNSFIKEATGEAFTTKDFRTWSATVEAYKCMKNACSEHPEECGEKEYKKMLTAVLKEVSQKLGNTVAVCRAHYVHQALQESFLAGSFAKSLRLKKRVARMKGLSQDEAELYALLAKIR